ncbi:mitochondrial genome maintenance exonuclease 1 [Tetranychus urticae]|uniref:Mitochondrial genome maintenance exonuclease 1 n=1 Tax=Tetranychus urticae TaxID=32264 RepID=T1JWZ8_TETUR|nr:mitochondrial genome maintenance exonuclease 1 [Tetranychus urticae]
MVLIKIFGKMHLVIGFGFRESSHLFGSCLHGLGSQIIRDIHFSSKSFYSKNNDFDEAQFDLENDLIYGSQSNAVDQSRSKIDSDKQAGCKISPKELINIYTEVLPVNWNPEELINFPMSNPWRSKSNLKTEEKTIEYELNCKRKLILDNNNLKVNEFPSVTKIIGETKSAASRQALEQWKRRMIEQLGEEKFKEYQQKIFRRGHLLHANIAKRLEEKSEEIEISEEISGYWKSLSNVFTNISKVQLLEKPVIHPFLCYKGIIDCVAYYNKTCYLIDWKTSSRPKPTIYNLYDEPIQVVSYLGALNFDSKYDYQVSKAAIVVAYEDGSPAHVHRISESLCKNYWISWVKRLHNYWLTNVKS